jgi:hypothetical protein
VQTCSKARKYGSYGMPMNWWIAMYALSRPWPCESQMSSAAVNRTSIGRATLIGRRSMIRRSSAKASGRAARGRPVLHLDELDPPRRGEDEIGPLGVVARREGLGRGPQQRRGPRRNGPAQPAHAAEHGVLEQVVVEPRR